MKEVLGKLRNTGHLFHAKKNSLEAITSPFEFAAESIKAARHEQNQDVILALPQLGVFGLFDGAGGHKDGLLAAQTASAAVSNYFQTNLPFIHDPRKLVTEALERANEEVHTLAQANNSDMLATAVVAYITTDVRGEMQLIVGNVGDSRAFIVTGSAEMDELSVADDMVETDLISKLLSSGLYSPSSTQLDARVAAKKKEIQLVLDTADNLHSIKPEHLSYFQRRHVVSRALGMTVIHPHLTERRLTAQQKLLLVTDGITDNLTLMAINKALQRKIPIEQMTESLVQMAHTISIDENKFRSQDDDMSAMTIRLKSSKAISS